MKWLRMIFVDRPPRPELLAEVQRRSESGFLIEPRRLIFDKRIDHRGQPRGRVHLCLFYGGMMRLPLPGAVPSRFGCINPTMKEVKSMISKHHLIWSLKLSGTAFRWWSQGEMLYPTAGFCDLKLPSPRSMTLTRALNKVFWLKVEAAEA